MTSPDKPMHRDRQPNSEAPRTYSRQAFHIEAITNEAEVNCVDVLFDNFNTYLDSARQHPVFLQHLDQTHIPSSPVEFTAAPKFTHFSRSNSSHSARLIPWSGSE